MSLSPPRWTLAEFEADAAKAITVFREERASEAREDYSSHFNEASDAIEDVLELSVDLSTLSTTGDKIVSNPRYLEALRYLGAPPVSEDDLETLSGIAKRLWAAANQWPGIVATVMSVFDHHRFPWLSSGREPTDAERHGAVVSTAALIAARRIMTARANEAKSAQEELVKAALRGVGFAQVQARTIVTLRTAPRPGEFCGESMLGSRKADLIVGLRDDRVLAVECKVSNSKVNSVKRVKNDAAVKARLWIQEFGTQAIVPAAVIAGVFNPPNLLSAQRDGLTVWWSHSLEHMVEWIGQTRPDRRSS